MLINGKWYTETELRAYIKKLETENQELKEQIDKITDHEGEDYYE